VLFPEKILPTLSPFFTAKRWLIAYSGGVDSRVLLDLLVRLKKKGRGSETSFPELVLVHIDHQIHPDSGSWAKQCKNQAEGLGLSVSIHRVDINNPALGSLEERARRARYDVFESLLTSDDVLMLGHHLDDQIETAFMRLLRGSGSRGIGAMPQTRSLGTGQLHRPLLAVSRAAIEEYARDMELSWIEDPSNLSSDYDRNFLRLQVLPLLERRWPEYRSTVSRAASLSEESAVLNSELAAIDFLSFELKPDSQSLSIRALQEVGRERQKNLIRYWLEQRQLSLPSSAQLECILDEVVCAGPDAAPLVQWSGGADARVQVRRFRDSLYVMKALDAVDSSIGYSWDLKSDLAIPGVGILSAGKVSGVGIRESLIDSGVGVVVRFRQGGERCQPCGRGSSQTLKKLLQEYRVETWKRDRIPLIYINDTLAAVVGYWICEGYAANSEIGVNITCDSAG
jgi:tRNA(Ile)-lysidine synthase